MSTHLILGAGPVGRHTTAALLAAGDEVVVGTRSGTTVPGARALVVQATDAEALTAAARGVRSIVVATNPAYHRWATDWPPVVDAVASAARRTGASVVLVGNFYAYGRPDGPLSLASPERPTETKGRVRAELWRTLLGAHHRGEFRAAEVRASDYFGPGAGKGAYAGDRLFVPVLANRAARVVGDPRTPHAMAYLPDFAATLAAVARADADALWGRPWFAPHASQCSLADFTARINALAGTRGRLRPYSSGTIDLLALLSPLLREVRAVSYQHREPWTVADTDTESLLGVAATPLEVALAATLASYRDGDRVGV